MPAVQTSYSAMMQPGLEGACATILNDDNSDTRICETVAGIPFGRVVSEGTNARGAVLGGVSGLIGLSILDRTLVSIFGGDVYRQGDAIGVLFAGEMWVRVVAAVTHGAIASYDAITGQLNPVSGGIELYGSRYITSAGAGQVALLRLTSSASAEDEAGGGGAPDWVPANAVVHIDFVGGTPQGRAWTEADGEVAISTLLGSDDNASMGWGFTGYDPVNLAADGYVLPTPSLGLALIATAKALVLNAATIRVQYKTASSAGDSGANFVMLSTDGADALEVDLIATQMTAYSWGGSASQSLDGIGNEGNSVFNCMAITVTGNRLDAAVNGSAAVTSALDATDRPSGNPMTCAVVDGARGSIVQSITIYDPLPDTTGLSELSAVV